MAVLRFVDLRSDTVTLPTEEMLEAIRTAELGDDVSREDTAVNVLEEMAASKMGKESAVLVTSGTQGNLVSVLSHTKRGDEIILEADSHIYHFEVGGLAVVGGEPELPPITKISPQEKGFLAGTENPRVKRKT